MAGMVELSEGNLKKKKTMINMVSILESMHEQLDDVSREMEIFKRNKKEMLEIKSTVT